MASLRIGNHLVGPGHPAFLVAEIGLNHNGHIPTALEMVRAAKTAGADAVKVQVYTSTEFCASDATYQGERQVDLFKRYELEEQAFRLIAEACAREGLVFFGTATDERSLDLLCRLGAPVIKVGSDDLVHSPLLRLIAERDRPVILSTGMASFDEIYDAVQEDLAECEDVILLHCVSLYPTPSRKANLGRIVSLARMFGPMVGYSDHTVGTKAPELAVALGAVMLEKHFTLDKKMAGPDHAFSADPHEFFEMMTAIRTAEKYLGDGIVDPSEEELEMRKLARRSIVAKTDLTAGWKLLDTDLAYKRPGLGLLPCENDKVIGRTLRRNLTVDERIVLEDVL